MKIVRNSGIDYISLDFKDGVEAKSIFKKGNVLGIDITDSSQFFSSDDGLTMKEACKLLGISESTMRRRIKSKKIKFTKPNGKDYRFKRKDLLKIA